MKYVYVQPENGASFWGLVAKTPEINYGSQLTSPVHLAQYEWLCNDRGKEQAEQWARRVVEQDPTVLDKTENLKYWPSDPMASMELGQRIAAMSERGKPSTGAADDDSSGKKEITYPCKNLDEIIRKGESILRKSESVKADSGDQTYVSHFSAHSAWIGVVCGRRSLTAQPTSTHNCL